MIDRMELHALADNELSADRCQELAALVDQDPQIKRELEAIRATKRCLKSTASDVEPGELWSRCQSRLDELDKARRIEGFVGKYAWGICGVFFVAIAMGGFFNRFQMKSVNSNQVAGYVATMSPIPVSESEKPSQFGEMFRRVLGGAPAERPARVVVTGIGGCDIPGKRSNYVRLDDGYGPVMVVALHDVQHVSGLYEFEQDARFKYGDIDGTSALFWNRPDGVICMAVGKRSYDEIHRIVTTVSDQRRR